MMRSWSGASHTTRQRLCGLPSPTGAVSRAIAALDGDWTSAVLYTTGPDKLVVLGTLVDFWPVLCEWDRVVCVLTLLSYLIRTYTVPAPMDVDGDSPPPAQPGASIPRARPAGRAPEGMVWKGGKRIS